MTPASGSALDWEGQTILDRTGEKIGTIEEIFLVEETDRPEWALVKTGRLKGRTTLVPLTRAFRGADGIKVHVAKDDVANAPAVDANSDPSEQQVMELYRHYGLPTSNGHGTSGSSQAPASPAPTPPASPFGAPSMSPSPPSSAPSPSPRSGPPAPGPSSQLAQPSPGPQLKDAPIGDLLKQAKEQGTELVKKEVDLAKAEMGDKVKDVGIGAGMFGGAGYVAHLASIALMLAIMFGLAEFMAPWLAALIVAVVYASVAGILALKARKKIKEAGPPIPERTIRSAKQTIETVKEEAKWGLGQTR